MYTRISDDHTGQRLGVQRQLDDCLALAEQLGWEVVTRYDDNDISAFNGKTRPGFEAMLTAMAKGEFGALICWHPDRLYRSMRDLERVTSILVTHQIRDAVYVAKHEAIQTDGHLAIREADAAKTKRTTFMVLHEGRMYFEGTANELLASRDRYLQEFLFMTLPPW